MPQRTPLTPHNSFRYKPFMANGTKFFSIWELVYKRKAVTQPKAPKRRGRPRRGQEGDSSSSQSPVGRTLRRGQVGDSSQPTQVRLRRGQDGDSSQPPPIRGRPKRRQVEVISRQLPPTISTTDVEHLVPCEAHEAHSQGPTSDSVGFTPCVTATLSGEHASRVFSKTPPHRFGNSVSRRAECN